MPLVHIQESFEIVNGGATYNLDANTNTTIYRVFSSGAVTPVGNHSFTISTAAYEGLNFTFRYLANATLNSPVTISFFGTTMPSTLGTKNCTVSAYYNGASWDVQFIPDLDQNGTLPYDVLPPDESFTAVNAFGGASPAFANVNYSSSGTVALGFRKRGDKRIEFRGTVTDAAGTNAQLFTLPAGYRPGRDKKYIIGGENTSSGLAIQVTLTINGTTSGTPGQVNIAGLPSAPCKIYFDGFVAFREDE